MKNLSRILSMMLCFAPLCVNAAGTVATTSGSNLTAFNPSNAYNNQWASLSNGRYDANAASAKVDFGNCNAVVLRCAQPKCSNGGCADSSVASAIVAGCVQSNENCKQYGNDLVQYMTAQLVASSNAKINEQNAAAQQAAAAAAAQQSQQQMAAMQQQMQQMQQQMAQQQAESAAQLQNALAQQAAQNASALESVKNAATDAAKENEAGISAYQQDAINRGVSADVIERQKITGQVMTELENAEVQLKTVRESMNAAFEYAKCDTRGNNCEGPKRVKKWRELATAFIQPYDETINKVYDALELAQLVGVDLSDIYMMLNNSCNRWGQYMCPGTGDTNSKVYYGYVDQPVDKKESPRVCNTCDSDGKNCHTPDESEWKKCRPCTLLKVLSNGEDVYEGWVYAEENAKSNQTIVACASGALDSSALFARRTKNKNGAGLVDLDKLETWLNQKEPPKKYKSGPDLVDYCNAGYDDYRELLEKSALSRVVPTKGAALCVKKIGYDEAKTEDKSEECGYISPIYAICDTHPYNAGKTSALDVKTGNDDDDKKCTAQEISNLDESAHIEWAYKDDKKTCKAKLCRPGYKPQDEDGKYGCVLATDEDWNEKGYKYKAALEAYNNYMRKQFGEMHEIIALKTTVISQQMYKQYEYLSATLRRLKTQLEKATLTATLQAAGAKDDTSSSGLLGGGSSKTSQYTNCSGKDEEGTLYCLRQNYAALSAVGKKCKKAEREQLEKDVKLINQLLGLGNESYDASCKFGDNNKNADCENCLSAYNIGLIKIKKENDEREFKLRGWGNNNQKFN